MPKAYVLVEIAVTDPEAFEAYKPLAEVALEAYGGRYLARGGETALLEGVGLPSRVTLLEFPDLDTATTWYSSPEYGEARAARAGAATARFVAVEGLEGAG
jgi:uncharacterized protein (DUF1330 family)